MRRSSLASAAKCFTALFCCVVEAGATSLHACLSAGLQRREEVHYYSRLGPLRLLYLLFHMFYNKDELLQ